LSALPEAAQQSTPQQAVGHYGKGSRPALGHGRGRFPPPSKLGGVTSGDLYDHLTALCKPSLRKKFLALLADEKLGAVPGWR